jgi:protein-glutamine gamma-glutamyltransferase
MPTLFAFRLSTYLTLALACISMAYAEWGVMRQASYFGVLVLALLGVAFWCEGRYELSIVAANRLGFVIGAVAVAWLAYQFVNKSSLIYRLPWPASLLPYLGPLLMILMPAKLFRPKHIGDWWAMQGIGLATASLGCAIEDDQIFAVLLGLYAVVGVWSLSLFFYLRVGGILPAVPKSDPGPAPTILASKVQVQELQFGRAFFARTFLWVLLAGGIAAPFFFFTPRSSAPQWKFGSTRMDTGLGNEQYVDLNKSGELSVNRDVVHEFHVTDVDNNPVNDFFLEHRFKCYVFNAYENGKWQKLNSEALIASGTKLILDGPSAPPKPDFGPGMQAILFTPKQRAEYILSDPVVWGVGDVMPIQCIVDGQHLPWFQMPDGTFRFLRLPPSPTNLISYRQYIRNTGNHEIDLSPPFELNSPFHRIGEPATPDNPLFLYRSLKLPKMRAWSREFFQKLADKEPEIAAALQRATPSPVFQFDPQDYELIARRFAVYLSTSGEFKYTLNLKRNDLTIDPIEEFLTKTKEGHCERYAAATVLVLRSVGIPANYISGYKGCEAEETPGMYSIRQEHAHAWCEVLIPRKAPAGFPYRRQTRDMVGGQPVLWHWLSLDPTPLDSEAVGVKTPGIVGFWSRVQVFFVEYVVGYNPERREQFVNTAQSWFTRERILWLLEGGGFVVLVCGLALVLVLRKRRRKHVQTTGVAWFDRFLSITSKVELNPVEGATPHELALSFCDAESIAIADEIVRRFYALRYGGQATSEAEINRMNLLNHQLEQRLVSAGVKS